MRILLVEDNELSRELFGDILEGAGHDLVIASDGITGRDLGLKGRFDLILLDLHLPGISGEQICRDLRAAGTGAPIIAISASAMPDEIARAMSAGFDGYLTKPVSPGQLRATLDPYLRRSSANDLATAQ